MVDYFVLDLEDPFGVRCDGGEVFKVSHHGEIEWTTVAKRAFEGSGGSKMMVRTVDTGPRNIFKYDPNCNLGHASPAKFLQGHNLFGSDDIELLARQCVERIADALEVPEPDMTVLPQGKIARVDLAGHWLLDREADVLPFLKAIQEHVVMPYRGRGIFGSGDPGTLYYGFKAKGERAGDWGLKLYAKGRELEKRPLPARAMAVPGLMDDLKRTIRVELTLRTAELKRLGLRRIKDWTPQYARDTWAQYVGKLNMEQLSLDLGAVNETAFLKPRLRDALNAWKAGIDLKDGRSRESFYRLRRELLALTGHDIKAPMPTCNVVPLLRTIEAKPARLPSWADDLAAALRAA